MTNLSLCRDSSVPCCRSRLVAATMAAWGQACRIAARASAASFRKQGMPGAENGAHHGHEVTYKGLTLHAPATWHTYVGKGMCSIMWFWIFYRAYHDGDAFLFGHAQHFEHELHQEGHHEATEGH